MCIRLRKFESRHTEQASRLRMRHTKVVSACYTSYSRIGMTGLVDVALSLVDIYMRAFIVVARYVQLRLCLNTKEPKHGQKHGDNT